jgi:hypothetical protein
MTTTQHQSCRQNVGIYDPRSDGADLRKSIDDGTLPGIVAGGGLAVGQGAHDGRVLLGGLARQPGAAGCLDGHQLPHRYAARRLHFVAAGLYPLVAPVLITKLTAKPLRGRQGAHTPGAIATPRLPGQRQREGAEQGGVGPQPHAVGYAPPRHSLATDPTERPTRAHRSVAQLTPHRLARVFVCVLPQHRPPARDAGEGRLHPRLHR